MDRCRTCAVINQPPGMISTKVNEAQRIWRERERLIMDHRASLADMWKLVHLIQARKDEDSDDDEEDDEYLVDEAVERVKAIGESLKSPKKDLNLTVKFDNEQTRRMCPLFYSSWHPNDFFQDPLDFKSLTLKVMLNPGTESEPASFEEGAQLYYDTYFEDLTTFSIPSIEFFESYRVSKRPTAKTKKTSGKPRRKCIEGECITECTRIPGVGESSHSKEPFNSKLAVSSKIKYCDDRNGGGKAGERRREDTGKEVSAAEKSMKTLSLSEAKLKRHLHHIPDEELGNDIAEDVIADRKGKSANEVVASMLEKWGVEHGEKMMIMTEFKFFGKSKDKLTKYNGDFDVFAISRRCGVLFFQVKGVAVKGGDYHQNSREKMSYAWKQVLRDVAFFRESNRDLGFMLDAAVHTFVAVPNMVEGDLDDIGLCRYHRQFVLCRTDLEGIASFSSWMRSRLLRDEGIGDNLSKENYRHICSRYLALVAKVNFPRRSLVIENTRGLVSAIKYGQQENIWAILTPEQLHAIYDQGSLKLITGEFGTGKSLVLVTKAKQLANDDCFVYLVTFAGVGTDVNCYHDTNCFSLNQLRQMMGHEPANVTLCQLSDIIKGFDEENNIETGQWTTVTANLLKDLFHWLVAKHRGKNVHFLFDEVPCYMFQSCERSLTEFPTNHEQNCLWLVLATHSHKPNQFKLSETPWFKHMMANGYSYTPLMYSMRFPEHVYRMVQIIRGNEDEASARKQRCGHVVAGPKPLVFILPKCTCQDGCEKKTIFLCQCLILRMKTTLESMFRILDPTETAIECNSYSILVGFFVGTNFQHHLCTNLREAFRSLKKELAFNLTAGAQAKMSPPDASRRETFNVYDRYTYIGCENTVVIDVDPYALHQCGVDNQWTYATMPFTRTVSQYVLFTWPKEEAKAMWDSDLKGHDEMTDRRVEEGQLTDELRDIRYEMTARARLSRGECLEKLVESNAVIVYRVGLPEPKPASTAP